VKDANGAAVTGESPLDPLERVRKQALLAIKKLTTLKSYEVDVAVSESTVTITGSATEDADIKKITKAVQNVSGQRNVTNTMTLRPRPADAELESAIKRALSDEANLNWEGITVRVVNGIAYFEGTKPNHRDIDRILSIANMVDGVARVESKMKVSR
jgi:osmotically-inducible protein OsmY